MQKFTVLESTKLEFGGFNTKLVSEVEGGIAGLTYWVKTVAEKKAGETIEINMDNFRIDQEETKSGHTVRVIRPKY